MQAQYTIIYALYYNSEIPSSKVVGSRTIVFLFPWKIVMTLFHWKDVYIEIVVRIFNFKLI